MSRVVRRNLALLAGERALRPRDASSVSHGLRRLRRGWVAQVGLLHAGEGWPVVAPLAGTRVVPVVALRGREVTRACHD